MLNMNRLVFRVKRLEEAEQTHMHVYIEYMDGGAKGRGRPTTT